MSNSGAIFRHVKVCQKILQIDFFGRSQLVMVQTEMGLNSAWMSSELFTDYFNEEIVPTIKKYFPQQRVIVTMDNATCHPPTLNDIDDLIDVQFLPPNTTSLIQPCDQQVIFHLKSRVRNVYFTKLLTYVRTHPEADNPYQDFL
ncbi:unnamed protein product, partial [Meganyctiphanes norvegica]